MITSPGEALSIAVCNSEMEETVMVSANALLNERRETIKRHNMIFNTGFLYEDVEIVFME
jgi:hypothetical protein